MDKIGRYRIIRRIGAGSFATVWLGHDDDLDVPVAVKILADNWAGNEDVRNRFLAEARIMRRIRDARIVQVYDIGTLSDGRPYFVMDWVNGGSLDDLRQQNIEPERALRLCAEACRAMQVLHENDIIHRDVTPANVLLSKKSGGQVQVLVADLGVAKSMIDSVGGTMTAGTPSYMALEQATGLGKLDHRADIYSLSALTYAMLTGRPPFPVTSLTDVLTRDRNARPEPIATRIGAPESLDAVLLSGVSSDPESRPPSASALADALDRIADQLHLQSTAFSPVPMNNGPGNGEYGSYPPNQPYSNGGIPAQNGYVQPPYQNPSPYGTYDPAGQPMPYDLATSGPSPNSGLEKPATRRPASFYVLIGVAALALFAISLLVTITILQ